MAGMSGYPIIILKEGAKRDVGREAQHKNITAARAVAEAVRTTLGPRGMDKMLVDSNGDVVVTNDGATVLWELDIEHPVAKMIVEVARAQDDEVGDGTTTAVVLAGELLKKAEELLDKGVHPTTIVQGYKTAEAKASEILESMSVEVTRDNREVLRKIAMTAMTGKGIEAMKEKLADIVVDAALAIEDNGKVDVENRVKIVKITGGSLADTELVHGIVLELERLNPEMPRRVENARIALLDATLELKKLGTDAKITISEVEGLRNFKEGEKKVLEAQVEALAKAGANVVLCQKGIGVAASHFLAKHNMLAARRVKDEDMKMLALATGARIIGDPMQASSQDLGHARVVEDRKIKKDKHMIFIEGCRDPKAVTIVVHGGSEVFLDEMERALNDALMVVGDVLSYRKIVPGGGAPEVEVAERMREYAATLSGREQLAVKAFADAVEVIPRTLAENAGLDPIDAIVALRAKHGEGHKAYGVNVLNGGTADMLDGGVVEPLKVKLQAVKSAAEVATMILRVDDVIAAKREELKPKPGQSPHDYTRM
ncbi:MAG: thermosome subunit [Methanothrix sp.]|uniref:Thermosome subunit n=2 Tax=Methanothrix TaxID=2222 RepID=A0B749_METTP|nr:thermosome subunit [Methanothrix thermoacetophila PT]MBC7079477.1 thermosome subunit [Methanothrix sp.]NPU87451.1 thermosome subunit [Methanothrix sp.]